ncbi:MAG: low specificity L-threonine aldolase [Hyphomicrobiaceae bacterium]
MSSAPSRQQFASDNNAGLCPEALEALIAANATGHEPAYGADRFSADLSARMSELFGRECRTFLVFTGSAANGLAISHLLRPSEAVVCHRNAHIAVDECGSVEFLSGGARLLTTDEADGRITLAGLERHLALIPDMRAQRPRVLSLTNTTEEGTVYQVDEVSSLAATAKAAGLKVHMDGARFANAIAATGATPAQMTWQAGVDVLSFGGTKNGLSAGEAVVFFDPALAEDFDRHQMHTGHLASKMRHLTAPWLALLKDDLWLRNARHANAMAARLAGHLREIEAVTIMQTVEANALFVEMAPGLQAALREAGWRFYTLDGKRRCRLMCGFDMTAETIDRFAADMARLARTAG